MFLAHGEDVADAKCTVTVRVPHRSAGEPSFLLSSAWELAHSLLRVRCCDRGIKCNIVISVDTTYQVIDARVMTTHTYSVCVAELFDELGKYLDIHPLVLGPSRAAALNESSPRIHTSGPGRFSRFFKRELQGRYRIAYTSVFFLL
jgi:hypothetical protein